MAGKRKVVYCYYYYSFTLMPDLWLGVCCSGFAETSHVNPSFEFEHMEVSLNITALDCDFIELTWVSL